jgi:hypothetical protein
MMAMNSVMLHRKDDPSHEYREIILYQAEEHFAVWVRELMSCRMKLLILSKGTGRAYYVVGHVWGQRSHHTGGLMRQETEAYTNQGCMKQFLHMNGQIYDPSRGGEVGREHRIWNAARGSVNSPNECGNGSVGESYSVCSE